MSINLTDIKSQIDQICIEKGLHPDEVMKAIEKSIASAYRKELGDKDKAYTCTFDFNNAEYKVYENIAVVDEVLYPQKERSLSEARLYNPNAEIGDNITTEVQMSDSIGFGRIASQVARQVLIQSINASKNSKILQDYKDKVGELVSIEVDYMKKNGYMIKMGQTTSFMSTEQLMPTDRPRPGQMLRAVIQDIREDDQGNTKIILSRTHPDFVLAVLRQEIPEYTAGMLVIKNIVREAGSRTKLLVCAADEESNIDPVGTILGKRNVRIINIMREISSSMQEKIDVIEYNPENVPLMIMDALEPAEIDTVEILDEDNRMANVYCTKEEAFLAVGRKGVNIRLASRLLDYNLQIITTDGEPDLKPKEEAVAA